MEEYKNNTNHWISIADVMSALMMIFLFIAIAFLYQLEKNKVKENYKEKKLKETFISKLKKEEAKNKKREFYRANLNKILHQEFDKDLTKWNAIITDNDIFRFNAPFKTGSSVIPDSFQKILEEFFPRYIKVLTQNNFKNEIDEIRVEGHTSNVWGKNSSKEEIYLNNMHLSQLRANNVLSFCYKIDNNIIKDNRIWLEKLLRANGMSFSKPIYIASNIVDLDKSKRVEFRVIAKKHIENLKKL